MRLSIPLLLPALLLGPVPAFLLGPAPNLAFAQDGTRPEQAPAVAATPAASTAFVSTATIARYASRSADDSNTRLCFGFLEFDVVCDAPVAHLNPLPQSQLAQAARETGRSAAD
ncbi:MAG TPA: hypothetical protein VKE26_02555 [Xanthobacteraceae bacterium]|nr:hypothetical protein [Xanthobacteraceae bacterium]